MSGTNIGINLAGLSMASTGSSHGVSYTDAEKRLFAAFATAILLGAEMEVAKDKQVAISEEELGVLQDVVEATPAANRSLPTLVSAAYKANFKRLFGKDAEVGDDDFPKLRDPTSIRLMLRGALTEIGALDVLAMVPKYGTKKDTKKAKSA
jgi:hypothetical protein